MLKRSFWILVSLATLVTYAQDDIELYVDAPNAVVVGEPFNITYVLKSEKNGTPILQKFPEVQNLQYYDSRFFSSSYTNIVFGTTTKFVQVYTFKWILTLAATSPGEITIPPLKVKFRGKEYQFRSVTIRVEKAPTNRLPKPNPNIARKFSEPGNVEIPKQNKNLFLRTFVSTTDVYEGEAIYVYVKLYTRYRLQIQDIKPPQFQNFWVHNLMDTKNLRFNREIVNGVPYYAVVIDKFLIYPQKPGTLTIDPYQLTVDIISDWGFSVRTEKLFSNKINIHVKPLPNKPADFSGAVGNFKLSVNVNSDTLQVDEPVSIKVIISGTGNFGLFDFPKPQIPASFEELEPKEIPQYKPTEYGITGRIIKEYIYIPRAAGKFKIPPMSFSYFDTQAKSFKTLKTDTIYLYIKGTYDTTASPNFVAYQNPVKQVGTDILYIDTNPPKLKQKGDFFTGSTLFWLYYPLTLMIFGLAVLIYKKYEKENADIKQVKAKRASRLSLKKLKAARHYLRRGTPEKFYEEISKALWNYISDKLSIDPAQLTRDVIREQLQAKNVPQELINEFISILDYAEFARYSQQTKEIPMASIYQRSLAIIDNLEKVLNNHKKA